MRERYVRKDEEQKEFELITENESALIAYRRIPYALFRLELEKDFDIYTKELNEICKFYKIYKKGKEFIPEGSNGDYIPARMRYKMVYSLINKEARFLFAESPDVVIGPKGDSGENLEEDRTMYTIMNDLIRTVFEKNSFSNILLKAAKDCFIGKRVACVVNFNEEDGVVISFLSSLEFMYELKPNTNGVLSKFVSFTVVRDSLSTKDKRIFKKKFTVEDDDYVYVQEELYDGGGELVETVTPKQKTKLKVIPAIVIINDGLSGDLLGESEVELLMDNELWYSKLANADNDALRKSMNPTKYTVDMQESSTRNLSTAAGAFWDLGSDQNLDSPSPKVGMLEPAMHYSDALKTTLDRIKTSGYELVDMPNITNETLAGIITTGKALKAIYWPLIVRCEEKMTIWGPALQKLANIIISGAIAYPKVVERYVNDKIEEVPYEVEVAMNMPLPEDEQEEKTMDLAEVESQTMSKKAYMKKWRSLTDNEVQEELNQMALERQLLEDSAFGGTSNGFNGDNTVSNSLQNASESDNFKLAGSTSLNKDGTQGGQGQNPTQSTNDKPQLNGTQIISLINILNQYKSGIISEQQAIILISAMGLDEKAAERLIKDEGIANE